jgi:Predicted glycosyltransferases
MGFFEEFRAAFFYDPIKALNALYWYLTRRRVRARNRLRQISSKTPYIYQIWIDTVEQLEATAHNAPQHIAGWHCRPRFSLIVHADEGATSDRLLALLRSAEVQCYTDWELIIVGDRAAFPAWKDSVGRVRWLQLERGSDVDALQAGLQDARGDFVMYIAPGALLSPIALFRVAEALQADPAATVLYGDHDQIDGNGRRTLPWFKPAWNPELFLAQDYVSPAYAIDANVAREVNERVTGVPEAASFALLLEATAVAGAKVVHVPHILCHHVDVMGVDNQLARQEAVTQHLRPHGGEVRAGRHGLVEVRWPLPKRLPQVSILIPTKDKAPLLRTCIESLLRLTRYKNFEVIVIDNGSVETDACNYLNELKENTKIKILHHDRPFNYSELNNMAVSYSDGEFICLLNNDTEIISPDWLEEMVRYAAQDDVGAVGAKLLYPDGTIQHAGVVIGIGGAAGHAHRFLRNDAPGYFGRAHAAHHVSAVTAACLLIAKRKFLAVGGLDAENLKVAFNDVDLCLRLQEAGWRNVYAPQAVLIHHESKSRGSDLTHKNIQRYLGELHFLQTRWGTENWLDPLHHPNLDRASETYVIRV